MQEPLVSLIIVNRNGREFVDACLKSIFALQFNNFEVVFCDNGSTDGSLEYVRGSFGNRNNLRIIENKASLGPAVGRNRGAKVANGKYLFFLDNDTQVQENCLSELVRVLEGDPKVGAAQAKLLRLGTDFYDCAGDYLGPLGFLIERSKGNKDTGQLDFLADILSAKSAASIIRKELFDRIGGFDEDFYMYLEETDLSWRVWLAGYRVVFVPGAIVYHAFNTARKSFKKYYSKYIVRFYGCRNYISTLIKNLEIANLVRILPLHILSWLAIALLFLFKGSISDSFYILCGISWNILNLDTLIKKRRFINKNIRKLSDKLILERIKSKEGIEDYLRKIFIYLKTSL